MAERAFNGKKSRFFFPHYIVKIRFKGFAEAKMIEEVFKTKIDPDRLAFQLDKLTHAILGNAKDQLRAEKREAKRSGQSAPTLVSDDGHRKSPLTMPLTFSSKTR